MNPALDISTSALIAQRTRMTAISSNMANMSTTRNEKGELEPYKPKVVSFQADTSVGSSGGVGVRVDEVTTLDIEPIYKHDPTHPDAITEGPHKGSVATPNINMMTEFTNAMEAARAYEANLGAIDITKDMSAQTLRIIA